MFDNEVLSPEVKSTEKLKEKSLQKKALVVYNDDFNTFDFVIESLVKICKHEPTQAEQCTWLIHYKGKCAVKNGAHKDLAPMKQALIERNISAQIED